MRLYLHLLAATALIYASPAALSQQPGLLDMTFDTEPLADLDIRCVVPAAGGKTYIGGAFTSVHGVPRQQIARLNGDGSLDTSFDPVAAGGGAQTVSQTKVLCLAVQSDGKVLVGGDFTRFNGVARRGVARLNSDGSLDSSFNPGTGIGGTNGVSVTSLVWQADGKVVICGSFSTFDGVPRSGLARLDSDGSLDTGFDPGTGPSKEIEAMVVQADGKVVIGGFFSAFNGTACNRLARLNTDGSLDSSFNIGSGPNDWIRTLALQADGKWLVGGAFTTFDGLTRRSIVRLNEDGSVDTGFNPGAGITFNFIPEILSIAPQADGRVVVGGRFNTYRGVQRLGVARINSNGTLDTAFDPGLDAGHWAYEQEVHVAVQTDGKVLVGGRAGLIRLDDSGQFDPGFNQGSGAKGQILSMAAQADGKIVIGGDFTSYAGRLRNRIARLNSDGSLDTGFNPGLGVRNTFFSSDPIAVHAVAVQPDGGVLISGDFDNVNGATRYRVARLLSNGDIDPGFDPDAVTSSTIHALALQPDGKVVIGGFFTTYAGTLRDRVVRLNSDGSLDTSFNPGVGPDQRVTAIALQPDGKVLIGGDFTRCFGAARRCIARLNSDGSLDTSFNPGAGAGGQSHLRVTSLAVQADGKVLAGGFFTTFGGKPRVGIVRLNGNGSVDTSFNPGTGTGAYTRALVRSMVVQADGRILLGGDFTTFSGVVRLNMDGSLDATFKSGSGASGPSAYLAASGAVSTLATQADGRVLAGGTFDSYQGKPRGNLVRLLNDADSTGGAFSFSSRLFLTAPASESTVVIIRRGQGDSAANVTVSTQDGAAAGAFSAALAGVDYEPVHTVVHFAAGETVKEVVVTLKPHADAAPNRRLHLNLSAPTDGMVLGSVESTEIRLLQPDSKPPVLTVTLPAAGARVVALPAPFQITGTVGDDQGIDRVETEYEGELLVATPGPGGHIMALPWEIAFTPKAPGQVSLAFTAYDLSGNSTTVVRSFEYERRYELRVLRSAPAAVAQDRAGVVSLRGLPSSGATLISPPASDAPQSWAVLAGTQVTLRATARQGHLFSHWQNLPAGAVARGHEAIFVMPDEDVTDLAAVFTLNPFTSNGAVPSRSWTVFQGLLREHGATPPGNDVIGFFSATLLPGTAALSGKVLMDGGSTIFTAVLQGDGSVWFQTAKSVTPTLAFAERLLTLSWTPQGLTMMVTATNGKVSTGLARRPVYNHVAPVRSALLGAGGRQGYYTLALPALEQNPPKPLADYPQGTGLAGLTLMRNGTLRLAGTLADGMTFTASSSLVEDDEAEFFIMLPAPGTSSRGTGFPFVVPKARNGKFGALLGTLAFVENQGAGHVSSADMMWFRPVAETPPSLVQAYRAGWPGGIAIGAVGAHYDPSLPVQGALGIGAVNSIVGNSRLLFTGAKLQASPQEIDFNTTNSRVSKILAEETSFTLTLVQATGMMRGGFTPDWTQPGQSQPRYQGVILQKGALKGGHGFFLSNRQNDPDPESGAVLLGAPAQGED